jgi:formate hydrogenlyase subunit 3/multisubunit Na+/H+ antiporter MnhD subunit
MYLKVQRYVFLGELPENLQEIKENSCSMLVPMVALACLCLLMGLLVLVPSLKQSILDPAVRVLSDGVKYSAVVMGR